MDFKSAVLQKYYEKMSQRKIKVDYSVRYVSEADRMRSTHVRMSETVRDSFN